MWIDHLVYGTSDLAVAVADIESLLGVAPVEGGRHEGFGTRNFLVGLGPSTYLEIIGPDRDQPEPSGGRPFGLDDLEEDRLVAWAVGVADIGAGRESLAGLELGEVRSMSRLTPAGERLEWRLTEPAGGVVPFLIEWGAAARHPAAGLDSSCSLAGLRVGATGAEQLKPALKQLGVDVRQSWDDRLAATIDTPIGRVVLW